MRAVIQRAYGQPDVLEVKDVERPILQDEEVLVKVKASSINAGNVVLLKGEPYLARLAFGLKKPKFEIPGGDVAGRVEAIGSQVKSFQVGDEVFGDLSSAGWGAYAEYVAIPEQALVRKPGNVTFAASAATPMAAVTALQAIRNKGKLESGQRVLIYGASGGVGTFAIQIAKVLGADVTAVCSRRNVKLVESLGADTILNYQEENFMISDQYDLILGVNGYQPISAYKKALHTGGQFIHVGGSEKQMFQVFLQSPWNRKKKLSLFLQKANRDDLQQVSEWLEAGTIKPVVDRVFSLEEIQAAFTYVIDGHAQGKVVISLD